MSQQINLYHRDSSRRRRALTPASALLYSALLILVGTSLAGIYLERQARETAVKAQALNRELEEANARRTKLVADHAMRTPNLQLAAEIASLDVRLKGRQEITEALKSGALGSTGGFSEHMRSFSRQDLEGLWLTGFDIASGGDDLTISGRALNAELVPLYLKRLNQEKPMQGRRFASLRIQQPAARDAVQAPASSVPRYLEFVISTGDLTDAGKPVAPRTSLQVRDPGKLRNASSKPQAAIMASASP